MHTLFLLPRSLRFCLCRHWAGALLSFFLLFTGALLPAVAHELPELGDVAGEDFPLMLEKKIGQQIMQEIRQREISYLDDYDVESYLNQLGGRLAGFSKDPGFGFEFFALNDLSINAFAMPGGYIGVHTGLLLAAQSESELAGVMAHEISHVTQRHIARQLYQSKRVSIASMVGMALGLLAAGSNPQVGAAAIAASQAGAMSAQLAYSRDFERESDRLGFEMLGRAGFDQHGMALFFERLRQASRLYENNATAYLRTHPLTSERIADMQNRETGLNYRQVPDSLDFHLVRAKLRALQGRADDAVKLFGGQIAERKFVNEAAAQYGMAYAHWRAREWDAAQSANETARRLGQSALLERLAAEIRLAQGKTEEALRLYRSAMERYPLNRALIYGYADALLSGRRFDVALRFAEEQLRVQPQDIRLHRQRAGAYAGLGKNAMQHRALAEVFALQGQTAGAIGQLELALKAGDANFYELSGIDARLRELKILRLEELKEKNP
ncbi:M48 family metalloprotease [Azonexus sp.]|uniref:beta-barrel assembly-enhancing protease n=1 Tax=Azonexus sp. TaxID=1872668 RepID=UPI0039E6FFF5